jgi:hypothetical protein
MRIAERSSWLFVISLVACAALCDQNKAKPCTITIAAAPGAVRSGAELRLQITMTNTSSEDITVPLVSRPDQADFHYELEVMNEKGQQAPQTAYGRMLKRDLAGSFGFSVAKPGETVKEELVVTKLYDITVPGKYTLQITGHWKDLGLVKSNSITIIVTP